MGEFRMPSLGADMEIGTIVEWRVRPGDVVHKGDIVAVVDTEKSDIEVEVFEDGVVEEILVEPGQEVPVGTPLARLGTGSTADSPVDGRDVVETNEAPVTTDAVETSHAPAASGTSPFVRASPRARKTARDAGIDLAAVAGSGPAGAVVSTDLDRTDGGTTPPSDRPRPEPGPTAGRVRDRKASMRHAIGELMGAISAREIPHYYLATTIDLRAAMEWLHEMNATRPVTERLLPVAMLLRATAVTARDQPGLNGFWDQDFVPADHVHLGVAVALRGGGLVAPAVHDADTRSVDELMAATRDLVMRAHAGRLRSSEMSDPTITVTSLGDQGVDEVYGVIYPPQVALVGFGRIADRPWASDGMLGVRPTVRATLAADHRVTDGHDGARFLSAIDRFLQNPEAW